MSDVPTSLANMRATAAAERRRVSGEIRGIDGEIAQTEKKHRAEVATVQKRQWAEVAELATRRRAMDDELAEIDHVLAALGDDVPRAAQRSRGGGRRRKRKAPAGERLLAVLAAEGGTAHLTVLAEKLRVEKAYVSTLLSQLGRGGRVRKLGGGRWTTDPEESSAAESVAA